MRAGRGLAVYVAAAFGLAYALDYAVILPLMEGEASGGALLALLLARMAAPAIGALLGSRAAGAGFRGACGLSRPHGGDWEAALFHPGVLAAAVYTAASLALLAAGLAEVCGYLLALGWALLLVGAAVLLAAVLAGATVNMAVALMEEVGWRGFMYTALSSLGLPRLAAAVASGAAWGLWHAPLVWHGYNFQLGLPGGCAGEPASGPAALAAFTAYATAAGVALALLRDRYGTVYSAAAGHGSINAVGGFYSIVAVGDRLVAPPAGLAVAAGFAAASLALWAAQRLGEGAARAEEG